MDPNLLKYKVAYLNKPLAYSFQDAAKDSRALNRDKFYPKEAYFSFNLNYLEPYEAQNKQLKN